MAIFAISVLAALICVILFIPIAFLVFPLINPLPNFAHYESHFIIPVSALTPEIPERVLFFLGCGFFLLGLPLAHLLLSRYLPKNRERLLNHLASSILAAFALLSFVFREPLKLGEYFSFAHPWQSAALGGLGALSILLARNYFPERPRSSQKSAARSLWAFGGWMISMAVAFVGSSQRILQEGDLAAEGHHFSAIYSSMMQVHGGKVALNDFSPTYGLYAHLLHPLFHYVELTPRSFSWLMAMMCFMSCCFLALFLESALKSRFIKTVGMICVSGLLCFYRPFPIHGDPYFQYFPLRVFFPSLYLASAGFYFLRPNRTGLIITSVITWVACLFNLDSGLFCIGSWLLCLPYIHRTLRPLRNSYLGVALSGACVVSLYALGIRIGFGVWPELWNLGVVAKLFSYYGYWMHPMPLIGAWLIYVLCTLFGLSVSVGFGFWGNRSEKQEWSFLWLISLMALAGFSYYQGRSVPGNLIASSYFVFLGLLILLDRLWSQPRLIARSAGVSLFAVLWMLLCMPVSYLAIGTLGLMGDMIPQVSQRIVASGKISEEFAYLTQVIPQGSKMIALTWASPLIHGITHAPPAAIDSIAEIVTVRDNNLLLQSLQFKEAEYIVQDRSAEKDPLAVAVQPWVDRGYRVLAHSPGGRFTILIPRTEP